MRGEAVDTQQNCESGKMTDAADIRAVYPRHTMKLVALLMGVPLDTARTWLYRHLSSARRVELATALLAEMDRQDVERTAVRRRLAAWASGE
jgi:hypothetical protein